MTKNAFILNFFKLYNMLWKLALPFLKKNRRLASGFQKRIDSSFHTKTDLWIQAASAGEAYLAATILKTLSPKTKLKILITTTTSQGVYILQTRLTGKAISPLIDLKIEWFPFDMPDTMKNAVTAINPRVMVLLETEIWPGLLYFLKINKTRIFIINARLSKNSYTHYMRTKFLWRHLSPDTILATSEKDAQRYKKIFKKAMVKTMPNIKFEATDNDAADVNTLKQIRKIIPQTLPLTILASVRRQEEKDITHILKIILKRAPNQVVAIFPRHMYRIKTWEKRLASHNLNFHLRSKINSCLKDPCIILWDTFGELKTAYSLAEVVFIGGSLKPMGGQNFIEPAIQGAVTITGPYYDDFAWTKDEIFTKKIVIKKNNWKAVAQTIIETLKKPGERSIRKDMALEYIKSNQGGTLQACHEILKVFDL